MSKLPVICFNSVTNYAKANWRHDLAPQTERVWSDWHGLDGYKNIVKEERGNTTRFSWTEGTTRTDWTYWLAVALYSDASTGYKGYVPIFHGRFVSKEMMQHAGWNPKDNSFKVSVSPKGLNGIYLDAVLIDYTNLDAYWIPNKEILDICKAQEGSSFNWFAIGDTKHINSMYFEYFEITMVPLEWIGSQLVPAGIGTNLSQKVNHIYIDTDHPSSDKVLFWAAIGGVPNKMYWQNGALKTTADSAQPSTSWQIAKDTLGTYIAVNGDWIVTKVFDPTFLKKARRKEN